MSRSRARRRGDTIWALSLFASKAPWTVFLAAAAAVASFKRGTYSAQLSGFYNGLYGMSPHQSKTGVYVYFFFLHPQS